MCCDTAYAWPSLPNHCTPVHSVTLRHRLLCTPSLSTQADCFWSKQACSHKEPSMLMTLVCCRAIDYSNFGPLVFPLLKVFFTPHPFGGQRRLIDITPSEVNAVARYTGLQLYKDDLFFSLDSVQVSPEECQELLRQLHALVDTIVQESPHPFDRYSFPHACVPSLK